MGCNNIENSVSLATELLRELKRQSKRWFISFIICLILLFASNMIWLYVWNQYDYAEYNVDSFDGGNANYIGNDGDINNGTCASTKTKEEK